MAPSDLASFLAGETPADGPPAPDGPAAEPMASASAARGRTATGMPKVVLNDRYEIDTAQPLPDLAHAGAHAFAARKIDGGGTVQLFALVARSGLPARTDILPALRAIEHVRVMNLLAHGVAYWPPDGVERG